MFLDTWLPSTHPAAAWGGQMGQYREARGASWAMLRARDSCQDLREKASALGCTQVNSHFNLYPCCSLES